MNYYRLTVAACTAARTVRVPQTLTFTASLRTSISSSLAPVNNTPLTSNRVEYQRNEFRGFSSGSGDGTDDDSESNVKPTTDTDSATTTDSKPVTTIKSEIEEIAASLKQPQPTNSESSDPFGRNYDDGPLNLGPTSEFPPKYARDPSKNHAVDTDSIQREITTEERQKLELLTKGRGSRLDLERLDDLADALAASWRNILSNNGSSGEDIAGLGEVMLEREEGLQRRTVLQDAHPEKQRWDALDEAEAQKANEQEKSLETEFLERRKKAAVGSGTNGDGTKDDMKYYDLLESHSLLDGSGPVIQEKATRQPLLRRDREQPQQFDNLTLSDTNTTNEDATKKLTTRYQQAGNTWEQSNTTLVETDLDPTLSSQIVLPLELSRPRRLNRNQATKIPEHHLHHNNLRLLRMYTTPMGQIRNRVETRLGARDQRKIARLVKRARWMGLIPHVGQWKVKDFGSGVPRERLDVLEHPKDWERVLESAGLLPPVIPPAMERDVLDAQRKRDVQKDLKGLGMLDDEGYLNVPLSELKQMDVGFRMGVDRLGLTRTKVS